jgi:HPt (histidine-containing phosphotransfer) domain-containing protein
MSHTNNDAVYSEFLPYADVKEGLGRVMESKPLYIKILNSFKDGDLTSGLIDSLRKDDFEEIAHAAHKLKGAAANLGLKKLYEEAGEIEKEAKNGVKPDDISVIEDIIQKTAAVICKLSERGVL